LIFDNMEVKLHFSRYEFKYILPYALRKSLESELQYFVELDPFVADKPGRKYFVRSLYYDNSCFSNYYEKIDGLMQRAKFRIRTYTNDGCDDCPEFLEVKGRRNNLVYKHRTKLFNNTQVDDILVDSPPVLPCKTFSSLGRTTNNVVCAVKDGPIKTKFLYEVFRKNLAPVMLVDYWRRPYVSKYDPEFRLTFDDNLYAAAAEDLFPAGHINARALLSGYTILEVKFRFHIPKWFHRLIQTMELRRVSISKYCEAIECHGMADKLE